MLRFGAIVEIAHRHQLADNLVLLVEPVLPALESLHLIRAEPLQRVQGPVQVLGQHVLVEAAAGKTAAGVTASKVGVRAAGAVEVAATRDIEDATADGKVDRLPVLSVEGEEGVRCVGLEDDCGRWGRQLGAGRGSREDHVGDVGQQAGEGDVQRNEQRGPW